MTYTFIERLLYISLQFLDISKFRNKIRNDFYLFYYYYYYFFFFFFFVANDTHSVIHWPIGNACIFINFSSTFRENFKEDKDSTQTKDAMVSLATSDRPPDDVKAFFGHPLTAATTAVNGADEHASAAALLHEYINLPAIDRSGMKIMDKLADARSVNRADQCSGCPQYYMIPNTRGGVIVFPLQGRV